MKKLTGILVAGLAVLLLGACGSSSDTKGSDEKKSDVATVETIKKAGVLKVGTSADFAPFEFHTMVDGKDEIVGVDIDLVNAIADKLGVKAEIVDTDFNAVLSGLKDGNVDIAVSGISATPERQKSFDFTDNYYNPPQKVLINKKNADKYTSVESLEGKKVGAQKGSIQEPIVTEQLKGANLVSIAKVPTMINEVKEGTLDAMVVEETVAESYIAQNPDLQLADIELKKDEGNAFAVALPKGSTELKDELDKIIKELIDSGKIDEFVKKNNELAEKNAE